MLEVVQIPILQDNYIYLVHDTVSQQTVAIDPGLAQPVLDVLAQRDWQLTYILNTHHHWDHVGGNVELKTKTGCRVLAGIGDAGRIPGFDRGLNDNEVFWLGQHPITVLATPGHTLHHVVYYFEQDDKLFCGDTLFVMGCGRLFEGSALQLWQSLQRLKALPLATQIYCTHEYTLANGQFALSIEADNLALQKKMAWVKGERANLQPTVPSTLADELATNPFLREESVSIQNMLQAQGWQPIQVFAELRWRKDNFI